MSTDSFTEISVACNPSEDLTIAQPRTSTIDDPSEELTHPSPLPFFNVSLPMEEVSQVVEASLTTVPIPTDIMVDAPTSYHVVESDSRKGGDLLTDSLGFQYVKKRVASVSTSWIWSIRTKKNRCLASVSQQGNIFTRSPKEHNNGGNPGAKLRAQAISLVKAAASYIKFGDCTKQVPLLFEVMSQRRPQITRLSWNSSHPTSCLTVAASSSRSGTST
ncbi:hypothetical protein Pcinc_004953 [Petrolisthes cinctipes]|uniref:Uncharacterized protein n=1 Tax=Petrolisthes cinctipes TaxID=88211 RepID=A0AAE1GDT2_PETCI|nr:hypothetical protein Pcinc_004953 [Petrolisthes cinctipes]